MAARPEGSKNLLRPGESYRAWREGELRAGREILHRHGIRGYHDARAAYVDNADLRGGLEERQAKGLGQRRVDEHAAAGRGQAKPRAPASRRAASTRGRCLPASIAPTSCRLTPARSARSEGVSSDSE